MAVKSCFSNTLSRLFSGTAKNELATGLVHLVGQFFQRLKARGVNGRHIAEPEDDDWRELVQTRNDRIELVCGAEEERAMYPEDADVGGNFFVLQDMDTTLSDIFCCHFRDGRSLRNFADKNQGRQNHSRFYGDS